MCADGFVCGRSADAAGVTGDTGLGSCGRVSSPRGFAEAEFSFEESFVIFSPVGGLRFRGENPDRLQ